VCQNDGAERVPANGISPLDLLRSVCFTSARKREWLNCFGVPIDARKRLLRLVDRVISDGARGAGAGVVFALLNLTQINFLGDFN